MSKESCKIHINKPVTWTIEKENLEDTLIKGKKNKLGKSNKSQGLLYLDIESAGEIDFSDHSCRIESKHEHICDKKMTSKLEYKNGDKDSVMTPLSVVNFHTHPLSCYIGADTIWGWPSGEDLAQCLDFAMNNNLTHIVFAVEGTYIIDVNKHLIEYFKKHKSLYNALKNNIEAIFKLTHKHRMYINDTNSDILLEDEFNNFFLKPLKIKEDKNILLSWIKLVNSLSINCINLLTKQFSSLYKKQLSLVNLNVSNISDKSDKVLKSKIYSIVFYPNDTIQWKIKDKNELFNKMSKKTMTIKLPNKIEYTAPFISESCKL